MTKVKVETLLKGLVSSIDCYADQEILIQSIVGQKLDTSFESLVPTIERQGFKVPICIIDYGDGTYGLGNGHHRFTVAILMCLDEIPVVMIDPYEDDMQRRHTDPENVHFEEAEYGLATWLYRNLGWDFSYAY